MINIRNIGFFILLSLILISCNKNDSGLIIINLVAKDFYSSERISAYKIELIKRKSFSFFSPNYSVDTLISDSLGKVSYSFENETGYYYKLVPINNLRHSGFDEVLLKEDESNNLEILVKKFNILRIHLTNTNSDYNNIWIIGNSGQDLIYNSLFFDTIFCYNKSIPDEIQLLKFKLYNESMWENYNGLDTNLFISNVDTFDFQFDY